MQRIKKINEGEGGVLHKKTGSLRLFRSTNQSIRPISVLNMQTCVSLRMH